MIIVAGLRRSGTSMLMNALKESGLDIVGEKFLSKDNQTVEGNPNGYWELPQTTMNTGLRRQLDGEVVKVMFEALSFSKPELIDKILLIFRDPNKNLFSMKLNNKIDFEDIFVIKQIVDIIDALEFVRDKKYKIVFYEDILARPKEFKSICKFTGGDWKKAAETVDQDLNRSKWVNSKYIDIWRIVYSRIRNGDIEGAIRTKPMIEIIFRRLYKEIYKG